MSRFAALHRAGDPLVLPNAWDYASAAALADAGFAAVGTTSLGVAAAYGLPDGQAATRAETLALTRRIVRLPCLVSVDVEAGFSADPAAVGELCAEVAAAGAVGVNVEDGRPDGGLAPVAVQAALVAAAKAAGPRLFVNARVDTYWLATVGAGSCGEPATPAETLRRAEAYLAAGADGIFVPGLTDPAVIGRLVGAVQAPLNVLATPGGPTVRQLAELGVRRVSTGSLLFRAALQATVQTARAVAGSDPVPPGIPSYAAVQRLVGGN